MAYVDSYSIRQGAITLYRRDAEGSEHKSRSWYAAFKLPKEKTIRRSLKVNNRFDAESLAEDLYFNLIQKSKRGLSLSSKQFNLVAKGFLKDLTGKVEGDSGLDRSEQKFKPVLLKNKSLTVSKYLIPYFGDKELLDITSRDIEDYKEWRNDYWVSGDGKEQAKISYIRDNRKVVRPKTLREKRAPNWNTVNKELGTLRQVFEFGRKKKLISENEIPLIRNVSRPNDGKSQKKPGITDDEVRHLLDRLVIRYHAQTNPKHKRSHKLLIHYISWMCLTGMRVAEAKNLTIDKCQKFEKDGVTYLRVYVWGKGKRRELVASSEALIVLDKLIFLHEQNAELNGWGFSRDMSLFTDQYGKQIGSFANSLNRAFDEASLLTDVYGSKRSAGSFRKYYITNALLVGKVNYFELAKQCGTSVNVIERYYAEIDVTRRPEVFSFDHALSGIYSDNPAQIMNDS